MEAESDELVQGPFLPAVDGTHINSGKKSFVIDLDEFPKIENNNYRQALAKTPGLLLSEETTPLVSIGYRGLNPDRVQFTQVLKDGIPIHADQFGYPEAYYTPPLDTVDRIEFVHGGAALMYGPQPGGSLNYITHRPQVDRQFSFGTLQTFGSDNYYSTFSYLDGTIGRAGYYGYFNHRETEGFRESNSEVRLNAGSAKLVLDATTDSRWILTIDGYQERHGEPGGLTFATGGNAVNYNEDRNATSRFFDLFELERYFVSLAWEKDFSERTRLTMTSWGGYYRRLVHVRTAAALALCPPARMRTPRPISSRNFTRLALKRGFDTITNFGRYQTIAGESSFTIPIRRARTGAATKNDRGGCSARIPMGISSMRRSLSKIGLSGAHSRLRPASVLRISGKA